MTLILKMVYFLSFLFIDLHTCFIKASIKCKKDSHTDSVLGLAWNKEFRSVFVYGYIMYFYSTSSAVLFNICNIYIYIWSFQNLNAGIYLQVQARTNLSRFGMSIQENARLPWITILIRQVLFVLSLFYFTSWLKKAFL